LSWKFWKKSRPQWPYYSAYYSKSHSKDFSSLADQTASEPNKSSEDEQLELGLDNDDLKIDEDPKEDLTTTTNSEDKDFEDRLDEILDLDLKPEGFERRLTELVKDYTEEPKGQFEPESNLIADSNDDLQLSLEEYFGAMKEYGY